MVELLIKLFCKDIKTTESVQYRTKVASLCSIVGIALNILLFAAKFLIGTISGSVAIVADAYNNITDAGTSAAMLMGVKISSYGAGDRHPMGHGRFEWIISTIVSFLVVVVGWGLLSDSWSNLHSTQLLTINIWMLIVMILSVGVKLYMYRYNHKYGKRFQSEVMKAVAKDSISDAIATSTVLISVVISYLFHINIDGICGIAVALFIIYNGISSIFETGGRIIGTAPSDEELDNLRSIILKHECIQEIDELIVEDYGMSRGKVIIKLSYEEDIQQNIIRQAVETIKCEVSRETGFDVVIMADPVRIDEETELILQEFTQELKKMESFSYIDHFRVIPCGGQAHIYCDISLEKEREKNEDTITDRLTECVRAHGDGYEFYPSYKIFHEVRNRPWGGKGFAKRYDEFMKNRMFPQYFGGSQEKHYEIISGLLQEVRDQKVLDVAAGTCDTVQFLDHQNSYTALDSSPEFMRVGKEKMKKTGFLKCNYVLGNACAIPGDANEYDVVLCNLSMQIIMPARVMIDEVRRVLKPGGMFIGSVPVHDTKKGMFQYNRQICTSTKLEQALQIGGFDVKILDERNGAVCYFVAKAR